jgi:DNA-binding NarL/FixJ family response regulator
MNEINVCIVDDNNELRMAMQEIISMAEGYKCIGSMSNSAEAMSEFGRAMIVRAPDRNFYEVRLRITRWIG